MKKYENIDSSKDFASIYNEGERILNNAVEDIYNTLLKELPTKELKKQFKINQEEWKKSFEYKIDKEITKAEDEVFKQYGSHDPGRFVVEGIIYENREKEYPKRMQELVTIWANLMK